MSDLHVGACELGAYITVRPVHRVFAPFSVHRHGGPAPPIDFLLSALYSFRHVAAELSMACSLNHRKATV